MWITRNLNMHKGKVDHNEVLVESAGRGDLAVVKRELDFGANIHHCNKHYTALGASAANGHLHIVQFLIESGANPYFPHDRKTARNVALAHKHDHVANYLEVVMKLPKWLNKMDDQTGYTPLTHAIVHNYLTNIETLLDFGADVCRVDRYCKTPLVYAIEKNSMEIVQKLLEKGAIVSAISALKRALELGRNDILKLLIDTKQPIIIGALFDDGHTFLTKSIATFNIEISRYLIENGADCEQVDFNNRTPLEKAVEINSFDIVDLLVTKGVQMTDQLKSTFFPKLAKEGTVQTYSFLIRNGWNVNAFDENGKTALSLSAYNQDLLVSRFLIDNGAKIELAKTDVQAFRKKSMDFDWYLKLFERQREMLEAQQEIALEMRFSEKILPI